MIKTKWNNSWNEFMTEDILDILNNIEKQIDNCTYYPTKENILRFMDIDLNKVKYIIVGMEPYPSFNEADNLPQATGRSFEVSEIIGKTWDYKIKQSSLRNILKAIYYNETKSKESLENIRKKITNKEFLICNPGDWFDKMEEQGVIFLNSTLTVEAGKVGSHQKIWEEFREKLISFLSTKDIIWMLWGNNAQNEVGKFLRTEKILSAPHPRLDNFIINNTFQYAKDINWKGK